MYLASGCVGKGPDGQHCCQVNGADCKYLVFEGPLPRCSIWNSIGSIRWKLSPIGRQFRKTYPGFNCKDYPQGIPAVMNNPTAGKCCFG